MLYFVATPIGNLKDISYRAIETLENVDVIACEDTRKTSILLNNYNIHKPLIAYHKFNETVSAKGIIELLKKGQEVAVVSDAGMPVISDPGSILIEKLKEEQIEYSVIPGANAALSALILSGFNAKYFTFLGFLPEKNKDKIDLLQSVKHLQTTLIFYVSPHNLEKDIMKCFEVLGPRQACLVKEITKVFESSTHFILGKIPEIEPKGEFVLVVEEATPQNGLESLTLEEQIEFYINAGLTKREAIKKVAKINSIDNIQKVLEDRKNENI